jgi:hypothetical protein
MTICTVHESLHRRLSESPAPHVPAGGNTRAPVNPGIVCGVYDTNHKSRMVTYQNNPAHYPGLSNFPLYFYHAVSRVP